MDYVSKIKQPIAQEFERFIELFNKSLSHSEGLLNDVLKHILQRQGKRMRPMLTLLMAKVYGQPTLETINAGISLELLHTASLVHDDVVDEALTRRGQASVNAEYQNKVAVLTGDYILSTSLIKVGETANFDIVLYLSRLGQTLAEGEILQLSNVANTEITEEVYYSIIKCKTAALFEACCAMGAMSVGANDDQLKAAREFGQKLGIIFQIRDDIFDYYDNNEKLGKPTGNDMLEGKLTLPVIHALLSTGDKTMTAIAYKVKDHTVTKEEIAQLVEFTKSNGGIEYAKEKMEELREDCIAYVNAEVNDAELKDSLLAYVDYVIGRTL